MKGKVALGARAVAGYVWGTNAGRRRHKQIRKKARRRDPKEQSMVA